MSGGSKDTKALFLGVAAIAAAGLLYFAYAQSTESAIETKKFSSGDDDVVSKRSQETSKTSNVKTSADGRIGESKMDDKALHAAIEELDKKGKAYFKNKQVSQNHCKAMQPYHYEAFLLCYFPLAVFASSKSFH